MKWKDSTIVNPNLVQNMNPNPNPYIQMIFIEPRQLNLVVVIRGGVATCIDQNTPQGHPQVQTAAQKKATLDFQQDKEVLLEAQQDFVDTSQLSTYGQVRAMPEIFEQLIRRFPTKKVSKIKDFFQKFFRTNP